MKLDQDKIKTFYENIPNVWPENDEWHKYSKETIHNYLSKFQIAQNSVVLNAGSGGNDYNLLCDMYHIDVAANKIQHLPKHLVSSVENIPLPSNLFEHIICVGSVINYTDAVATIAEFSRLIQHNGQLILEFESSWGFEHLGTDAFKKSAALVNLKYNDEAHPQWIYSYNYIRKILISYGFKIHAVDRFHIFSAFKYNKKNDENYAAQFAKYDIILKRIPILKNYSNNIIIHCTRL